MLKGAPACEADIDRLYHKLVPAMTAMAAKTARLIPGAAEAVAELHALGVKIGSGTGYTREMMADILPSVARQGYAPDMVVCAGETPSGRPSPLMLWKALIALDAWPAGACIKVDDAPVGIEEGPRGGLLDRGLLGLGQRRGTGPGCVLGPGAGRPGRTGPPVRTGAGRRPARSLVVEDVSHLLPVVHEIARRIAPRHERVPASEKAHAKLVERLRGWLARAPAPVFGLYGGLMAFGAYFAMGVLCRPFTVSSYADAAPILVDYKIALVIAQVLGYALSKVAGIKVISEMPPHRRALAILVLIAAAEFCLVLFAVIPAPWNIACLFANGLALGMIWGLVFGFLEGRRLSELLGAMLCASFIVSSGVVKSAGESVMLLGWADEYWMPALTGLLFVPLLLFCVGGLAILPPPNAEDERLRVARTPMNAAARRAMFLNFAPGLIALMVIYVGLTALRDFRDNFAVEIWKGLGFGNNAEIFTLSELPVAAIVLTLMALLMFIANNRRAFLANLVLVAVGLGLAGLSSLAFQMHLIGPVTWMIALGRGYRLYAFQCAAVRSFHRGQRPLRHRRVPDLCRRRQWLSEFGRPADFLQLCGLAGFPGRIPDCHFLCCGAGGTCPGCGGGLLLPSSPCTGKQR